MVDDELDLTQPASTKPVTAADAFLKHAENVGVIDTTAPADAAPAPLWRDALFAAAAVLGAAVGSSVTTVCGDFGGEPTFTGDERAFEGVGKGMGLKNCWRGMLLVDCQRGTLCRD